MKRYYSKGTKIYLPFDLVASFSVSLFCVHVIWWADEHFMRINTCPHFPFRCMTVTICADVRKPVNHPLEFVLSRGWGPGPGVIVIWCDGVVVSKATHDWKKNILLNFGNILPFIRDLMFITLITLWRYLVSYHKH